MAAALFLWAVVRGTASISVRWQPRECEEVDLCDWLSKPVDKTAWSIDPELLHLLDSDPQFGGALGHRSDEIARRVRVVARACCSLCRFALPQAQWGTGTSPG